MDKLFIPPPPLSPSLISLMVSVDTKHLDYLLANIYTHLDGKQQNCSGIPLEIKKFKEGKKARNTRNIS